MSAFRHHKKRHRLTRAADGYMIDYYGKHISDAKGHYVYARKNEIKRLRRLAEMEERAQRHHRLAYERKMGKGSYRRDLESLYEGKRARKAKLQRRRKSTRSRRSR